MSEIRIGLFGLGHRGMHWLRLLQRIPGYRITAHRGHLHGASRAWRGRPGRSARCRDVRPLRGHAGRPERGRHRPHGSLQGAGRDGRPGPGGWQARQRGGARRPHDGGLLAHRRRAGEIGAGVPAWRAVALRRVLPGLEGPGTAGQAGADRIFRGRVRQLQGHSAVPPGLGHRPVRLPVRSGQAPERQADVDPRDGPDPLPRARAESRC